MSVFESVGVLKDSTFLYTLTSMTLTSLTTNFFKLLAGRNFPKSFLGMYWNEKRTWSSNASCSIWKRKESVGLTSFRNNFHLKFWSYLLVTFCLKNVSAFIGFLLRWWHFLLCWWKHSQKRAICEADDVFLNTKGSAKNWGQWNDVFKNSSLKLTKTYGVSLFCNFAQFWTEFFI